MKRGVLLFIFVFFIMGMLFVYFFIPINTVQYEWNSGTSGNPTVENSNFNINSSYEGMQFYNNMRYRTKDISYKIYNACPLKRQNDVTEALDIISNATILSFYPVESNEEISITCSYENIVEGNAFVGGEGGVTNVTVAGNYNIIFNGKVLLLRDSECYNPNIAIHELLHALGFDHSDNPNNIMYPTSSCDQTIGEDIPSLIKQLYSIEPAPDLVFENLSAVMNGKYLDANLSVRNKGFEDAPDFKIIISVDGKEIKEIESSGLAIGYGNKITLTNLWVNKISVNQIEFTISTDYAELNKDNNVAVSTFGKSS